MSDAYRFEDRGGEHAALVRVADGAIIPTGGPALDYLAVRLWRMEAAR